MRSIARWGLAACAAALPVFLGAPGCSPATDVERAYMESRRDEREQREQMQQTLEGVSESAAAIDMARASPAADGQGTAGQWVERLTASEKGSVLFPRWEGVRRSLHKYEVRYTYTVMAEAGGITKRGYAWDADLMLKSVTGPRELEEASLATRSSPYFPKPRLEPPQEKPKLEE
jgi:hypothetical protein